MKIVKDFTEYQILAMSNSMKVENWNGIILKRPDPQIIWKDTMPNVKIDAIYNRSNKGGGSWDIKSKNMPTVWQIHYKDLTFNLKLMGLKHTGLFQEEAYGWNLIEEIIKKANREVKVLNLFAYTGAASIAALHAGASVVHVDSSKGMVQWAKENVYSSHLENRPVRFIVDDVVKFVKREIRRNHKYDIILMDPPSFGRGANKEVWNLEKDLYPLVEDCVNLLSDNPLLFIINSYTTGLSKSVLENILYKTVNQKIKGIISSDELGIQMKDSNLVLPCGIYGRWERK